MLCKVIFTGQAEVSADADLNEHMDTMFDGNFLEEIAEGFSSVAGSLFTSICSYTNEIGHEVTERGVGFGEWDAGFYVDSDDCIAIIEKVVQKFSRAYESSLFRWSIRSSAHQGATIEDADSYE